jgi:hypothetical protein
MSSSGVGCSCGLASRAARAAGARVCSYALPRAGDYGAVSTQGCERGPHEIEQNDAAHARIMRGFFRVNWEDPQLYHVVLNTGSVPSTLA